MNLRSVSFCSVCVFLLSSRSLAADSHSNSTSVDVQKLCDALNLCNGTDNSNVAELAKCIRSSQDADHIDSPSDGKSSKPTPQEVWGFGLLFVSAISLCSLLGVSVMPLMQKWYYKQLLTSLIGLAVGSLSSSSLFHLVPQAFSLVDSDFHHQYLHISLSIWMGIWVFFMVERLLKIINDAKQRCEKTSLHDGEVPLQNVSALSSPNQNGIYDCQEQAIKASFGHQERPKVCSSFTNLAGDIKKIEHGLQKGDNVIATVAWMVIFGDGLHNFIDGLSIGTAFNQSILTGISISLAVMCEEFPHELGDFAVLLNAGMTIRQALLYNFLSACTCYVGLIIGIIVGDIEWNIYIFGFAAGMFLYIALVDMVPEMNEVVEEASKESIGAAFQALVLQNIGIFTGVTALFLLAKYPEYFTIT
ncbi:unnamed protein product [Bemisia tabaci]|uniref:Zinc transporter ZIP14 n=1 Tax=Bemisia tabaci TaxID=7038 RepID=A0A9P0ABA6_BEMTA|nr:unnamed protein product [Bemisia tabaci]